VAEPLARRNLDFFCAVIIVGLLAGFGASLGREGAPRQFAAALGDLGTGWLAGTHLHVPAVSLSGAAGVLAVTQGSPIWASIFVWELARPPIWLFLVFLLTACGAHGLKVLVVGRGPTHAG
jgi:H+/Cl- antiporter ClcA